MCSYLKNVRQRVQINVKFSSLKEVTVGVPQGPVGVSPSLLFNFLSDLFLFIYFSTSNSYADDNNLFATGTSIELINQMLLSNFRTVNNWFMKPYDHDPGNDNLFFKNGNEE